MRCTSLIARTVLLVACAVTFAGCGPHMTIQPSIRPYGRRMPAMPAGTVPTRGRLEALTAQQVGTAANPLPATAENLRLGRIYYGYYCVMCHGEKGDGDGPVGESYVPKPADLTSPAVAGLTDGQLYSRMLTGTGHDPVLIQTVLPEHRWPLVMYVRTLAKPAGAPAAPPPPKPAPMPPTGPMKM